MCFSESERNVVLDKLEIYEKFRRNGYGRGAVIVGLKTFTNRLGPTFDTFRIVVDKNNTAAINLYTSLGFKALSDTALTQYLGDLKDYITSRMDILDLTQTDFMDRYPKPQL